MAKGSTPRRAGKLFCPASAIIAAALACTVGLSSQFVRAAEKPTATHRELSIRVMTPDGALDGALNGAPDSTPLKTPLGSLWKLFIYAYQSETESEERPYVCQGRDPDELFCCKPGEAIERELALARSCTPYFQPSRLSIDAKQWSAFWKQRLSDAPEWLFELEKLRPERRVSVAELLRALIGVRREFKTFPRIEAAALGTVLRGTASGALKTWGSTLRVKTFTWRDDETRAAPMSERDELGFTGGFAGWLRDGSAIWASGPGHGRDIFLAELKAVVDEHLAAPEAGCVRVSYFNQYPIESVVPGAGALRGPVRIKFKNGNVLSFQGDGSLEATRVGTVKKAAMARPAQSHESGEIKISALLPVNEYVARVLEREVETVPLEAARAFAIAIRTFLYQNAKAQGTCLAINDSSHQQRVSPEAASNAALKIARWSDGLVLDRIDGLRYHSSKASENRMSWTQAKGLAEAGFAMEEILKTAYPTGVIAFGEAAHKLKRVKCEPNATVANWLEVQAKRWRQKLDGVPGFERPEALKICRGDRALSYPAAETLYVPPLMSRDDEVSVLHEYLHIGFRNHPRSRDEAFIERTARLLLEEK